MTALQVYAVEAEAHTGAGLATLRWASGTGFTSRTTDTPASTHFDPRILEPANMSRMVFADGRTAGRSQVGAGAMVLINDDGGLDHLLDYGLDGRAISIWVGAQGGAFPSEFTRVFRGTMDLPEISASRAVIRLRDRLAELDRPLQSNRYAGTNVGTAGIEGGAEIAGQPKPRCWGSKRNVTPVLVNAALLIFQVNDGAVAGIDAVRDLGVPYDFDGDYPDLAALQGAAVAEGTYATCIALGLFRLGSRAGGVTADVRGDSAGGYVTTAAEIIERIATSAGGLTAAEVDAAAIAAVAAAAPAPVGLYVAEARTVLEVLDELCESIGAYYWFDLAGVFRLGRLVAPGAPVMTLTEVEILAIERQATNDAGNGLPVRRVLLDYDHNPTVLTEVLGAVAEEDRAWLGSAWRTVETAEDAAVAAKHPLAPELRRQTLLVAKADAEAEAARLQALYGTRRDMVRVKVRLDRTNAAIDLGTELRIATAQLGYAAGRDFVCLGIETTGARDTMTLTLWG